jgi:predicted PurR-regulated permease PerM
MSQKSSSNPWQILSNSALLRFLLLFGCSWATVLLINYFYTTIALFTAASIFAVLLNYPVVWLSLYMPRKLAITVTFIGAVFIAWFGYADWSGSVESGTEFANPD